MPYNEYRPMGNDTIGALTDADRIALRQQELQQAIGRRAPAAKPQANPLEFLLSNALQQKAQEQAAPETAASYLTDQQKKALATKQFRDAMGIEQTGYGYRTKPKTAQEEYADEEGRIRLDMLKTVGDALRQSGAPQASAPVTVEEVPALKLPSGGAVAVPKEQQAYGGNVDPEERRARALMEQKTGQPIPSPYTTKGVFTGAPPGPAGPQSNPIFSPEDIRRIGLGFLGQTPSASPQEADDLFLRELLQSAAKQRAESGDFAGAIEGYRSGTFKPAAGQASEAATAFFQRAGTQAELEDIARAAGEAAHSINPDISSLQQRVNNLIARAEAEGASPDDVRAFIRMRINEAVPEPGFWGHPLSWATYGLSSKKNVREGLLK